MAAIKIYLFVFVVCWCKLCCAADNVLSTALSIDAVCSTRWGKWSVNGAVVRFWDSKPKVRYVAIEMDATRFFDGEMQLITEWNKYDDNTMGFLCQKLERCGVQQYRMCIEWAEAKCTLYSICIAPVHCTKEWFVE
jgi:hypothetical protein